MPGSWLVFLITDGVQSSEHLVVHLLLVALSFVTFLDLHPEQFNLLLHQRFLLFELGFALAIILL